MLLGRVLWILLMLVCLREPLKVEFVLAGLTGVIVHTTLTRTTPKAGCRLALG